MSFDPSALIGLAGALAKAGAPILGTAIGGPAGGAIAGVVIGALADALGTDATPEAVAAKVNADPVAAGPIVAKVEAEKRNAVLDELNARIADVQDARHTTVELAQAGSVISFGAPLVSAIVLVGFIVLSFLAMKPDAAGIRADVALYLLGAWQSLATAVVGYWVGSSASSAKKDQTIEATLTRAAAPVGRAVERVVEKAVSKAGR